MEDKVLLKLIKKIQVPIVGLLIENDLAEFIKEPDIDTDKEVSHSLDNIIPKGYRKIYLTKDQIKSYRYLFPSSRRGSAAIVKKKLEKFITEHDVDFEVLYEITKEYVDLTMHSSGEQFVKSANNIAYKRVKGGEESLLFNLLEERNNTVENVKSISTVDLDDYENLEQ